MSAPRNPRPRLVLSFLWFLRGEAEGALAIVAFAVVVVVALLLRFPPWAH